MSEPSVEKHNLHSTVFSARNNNIARGKDAVSTVWNEQSISENKNSYDRAGVEGERIIQFAPSRDQNPRSGDKSRPHAGATWHDKQSSCALEVDIVKKSIVNPDISMYLSNEANTSQSHTDEVPVHVLPQLRVLWDEELMRDKKESQSGDSMTTLSNSTRGGTPFSPGERNGDFANIGNERNTLSDRTLSQSFYDNDISGQ